MCYTWYSEWLIAISVDIHPDRSIQERKESEGYNLPGDAEAFLPSCVMCVAVGRMRVDRLIDI